MNSQGLLEVASPLTGNIKLNASTSNASVTILNQNGGVVKTLNLGAQSAGMVKFEWDGQLDDGSYAMPGIYKVEAEADVNGKNTALESYISAKVESVDLGDPKRGVVLNLGELGSVEFSKVKQVF